MDLLDLTVAAHGGLDGWRQLSTARAHVLAGGGLFPLKHQDGVISDTVVTIDPHRQWASHEPFGKPGVRSVFTGDHIAIETTDGAVLDERAHPRASFADHRLDTPWDQLHLAYFGAYAMWTYLTTPFLFTYPDVSTREIDPWQEDGETWRRLEVTFPDRIATHCARQTFSVDDDGLIRRHDYVADVVGGGPVAHYTSEHRIVDGVVVPTRRRVHPVGPDGRPVFDRTMVALDLDDISFR